MVNARWISSVSELLELGDAYDRLVIGAGDHGFFYLRDWIRRIWPFYGARGDQLAFLVAESDGRLVGVAPLQLEAKDWKHAGVRRLRFFGDLDSSLLNGTRDFLIPDPGDVAACVDAFVRLLREQAGHWDLIELNMIPGGSPVVSSLLEKLPGARKGGMDLQTPLIDLSGGFEAYQASFSGQMRNQLGRKMRKLQRELPTAKFSMSPAISLDRMTQLAALHRQRQETMRLAGRPWRKSLFDDPLQTRVYADLLDWAGRQDYARHYWLEVDEKLQLFLICFHYGNTLFYHLTALTEQMRNYSGGMLLLYWMFEQESRNHGTRQVNMLPGLNATKERLANKIVPLTRICAINTENRLSRAKCLWLGFGRKICRQ